MLALIDADILCYKAGFSAQHTRYRFVYNNGSKIDYEDLNLIEVKKDLKQRGLTESQGKLQKLIYPEPVEYALQRVKMLMESILDGSKADSYKTYLTSDDKTNYRFKVAKTQEYKGNRKNMKRPIHYEVIREYLQKYYDAEMTHDQEADDAMGIEQMKHLDKSIICTIDKDLDMIPGYHYNIDTQDIYMSVDPGNLRLSDSRTKVIGRGFKFFYAQMLLGDNADNIPGINGYGPVKVYETLKDLQDEDGLIEVTKAIYKKKYGKDFINQYREMSDLLWIRRFEGEFKSRMM